ENICRQNRTSGDSCTGACRAAIVHAAGLEILAGFVKLAVADINVSCRWPIIVTIAVIPRGAPRLNDGPVIDGDPDIFDFPVVACAVMGSYSDLHLRRRAGGGQARVGTRVQAYCLGNGIPARPQRNGDGEVAVPDYYV